jgi:hypothetical protein
VPSEASGVSNLPGGEKVLSMVKEGTDAAKNALPGTAQLKGAIDSQTTDKINNLTTSASSKFSSVKDAVTAKLSVAEKAQLASGLSSIATQGKKKIKLPTVSTNTVDRSKITSSTKSLLGDSRIPEPDFTGETRSNTPSNATSNSASTNPAAPLSAPAITRINTLKQKIQLIDVQILNLRGRDGAKLLEEERQAPAGDPSIKRKKDELQAKIAALVKDKEYAQKDIELIQKG